MVIFRYGYIPIIKLQKIHRIFCNIVIIKTYAMTINMSQGQSFNRVCIFLGLVVRSILHTNIYLVHTKKANFFKVFLHKNILLLNMTFLVNLVIL